MKKKDKRHKKQEKTRYTYSSYEKKKKKRCVQHTEIRPNSSVYLSEAGIQTDYVTLHVPVIYQFTAETTKRLYNVTLRLWPHEERCCELQHGPILSRSAYCIAFKHYRCTTKPTTEAVSNDRHWKQNLDHHQGQTTQQVSAKASMPQWN